MIANVYGVQDICWRIRKIIKTKAGRAALLVCDAHHSGASTCHRSIPCARYGVNTTFGSGEIIKILRH